MPAEPSQDTRIERFAVTLREASSATGLDVGGARILRLHGSGIYLLPKEGIVARLIEATDENRVRASRAVQVTGWLVARGFPATEPVYDSPVELGTDSPVELGAVIATFWRYLPQPATRRPPLEMAEAIGCLLRELHDQPPPPFQLPPVDPLARLQGALALDAGRQTPVLTEDEQAFLTERMAVLTDSYSALSSPPGTGSPLGTGLIHNDAHIGNLLVAEHRLCGNVLGDWESACIGPREIDLILEGAPGNRFRESGELRQAFSRAYGYDIAGWPGWRVLRDLRDLHSLGSHIRTGSAKPASRAELKKRLGSLRSGDQSIIWAAVA